MRRTLRRAWQFELVYRQGRKRSSPALVIFHYEDALDPSVAFVASRKVGSAVVRNRAKRLMRAAWSSLGTRRQWSGWYVLVARRDIARCSTVQVVEQLERALASDADAAPSP
jgi:ribonuclease P protein component